MFIQLSQTASKHYNDEPV